MNSVIEKIRRIGIVPVVAIDNVNASVKLAQALCDGGIHCAEVTFRTEAAEASIRTMSKEFPKMLIGAGTVLTTEQADRAVDAGACFLVSPGLNPRVVEYCLKKGITIIPGCSNPSDIEIAIELGLNVVKFFPAEAAGGIKMVKAMSAPYGNICFMPTGGINEKNLNEYLAFSKVIACGGSWMVDKNLIAAGDFETIKVLTRQAVNIMLDFELADIDGAPQNNKTPFAFKALFGFPKKINCSDFIGSETATCVDTAHISISTPNMERAIYHLGLLGVEGDLQSLKYDENGEISSVNLKKPIDGFDVRLMKRI